MLVQLFERRVLTYTPSNPTQYQVEFGNIGQHYHAWRDENAQVGDVPAEGATIYESDLTDWPQETTDLGQSFVQGGTYHIRNDSNGYDYLWYLTADAGGPGSFGDASFSVDLRMVSDSNEGYGCLLAHTVSDPGSGNLTEDYSFCADGYQSAENGGYGTVSVAHETFDPASINYLLDFTTPVSLHTKNEWNTLTLVIRGHQIWFLVNGTPVVSVNAPHGGVNASGPLSGDVGVLVFNADDQPAEFEFRNLIVKALQ